MSESFEKVCASYDDCTWIGRDGVKKAIDRLKAAHESEIAELQRRYEQNVIELQRAHRREMEAVRDPQRIGGTLERDSFEYALEQLREFRWQHATNDNDAIPYINGIAKAHEHEMECLRKKRFREGYEAGQRRLVEILEDKDGNDDYDYAHDCGCANHSCDQHGRQVSYDELGNERRKAVCELRNMQMDTGNAIKKLAVALGLEWNPNNAPKSVALLQNRIIHLLGGDEPNFTEIAKTINLGDKSDGELMENGENHKFDWRITDELRKFKGRINAELTPETVLAIRAEINCIADRIDAQFDRICEQNEAVLQQTIDEMVTELDSARAKNRRLTRHIDQMQGGSRKWREECEALKATNADLAKGIDDARESEYRAERQRDELQAKLDDYDRTHVELPKDESNEYIHIGDVMDGYAKTIEVVELRYGRSGWVLISRDGNGYADTFAFAHHHEPTVEQVIRDLTLGKITESQAIERIEGINGQG